MEEEMFDRILVPLDGSEFAERALSYAKDLGLISGGGITLLSVIQPVDAPFAPSAAPDEPDEHRRKPWLTYVEKQAAALREAGVSDVAAVLRFGEPSRMITEAARELQADLVVMSTQGLGADGRYGLGSIALKVLMTAPCPLLMVRINKPEPPRTQAEERWQSEGGANVG
jgi:nucleotide-binding universal stress UspA family protein